MRWHRLNGAYNTASEPAKFDMRLNAQAMPVTDLEGFLPAVGVVVPSGSKLQGGSLTANLTVTGPADKLVISGPINLSNAKLAGFSLKSKLGALGSIPGLGGSGGGGGGGSDTDIQTLSATMRNDPSGTTIDSLNLVMPSLGTVTGNGTVSAAGQLNFKMVANLSGAAGALTGAAGCGRCGRSASWVAASSVLSLGRRGRRRWLEQRNPIHRAGHHVKSAGDS